MLQLLDTVKCTNARSDTDDEQQKMVIDKRINALTI